MTEFLKKQALKGGNEIISYYSKKYRKVVRSYGNGNKGAHVVGHYADVARLVGLTERELYAQLKELKCSWSMYYPFQSISNRLFFRSGGEQFAICKVISSWFASIS